MNCHFHPGKPATHTDSIVDLDSPSKNLHEVQYKRVPICSACAIERGEANTSRVKPIAPRCKHCWREIAQMRAAADAPLTWWHVFAESSRFRQHCDETWKCRAEPEV